MWWWLAWVCACYVFVGIVVFALAFSTGNGFLIDLSLLAYVLNLVGLRSANAKDW